MSDKPKLQANFKTNDGDLINVYAESADELANLLNTLAQASPLISSTGAALRGQPVQPGVAALQQAGFNPQPVPQAAPAPAQAPPTVDTNVPTGGGPACAHGTKVWKQGEKNGRQWKAWMCPTKVPGCAPTWA